MTPWLDDGDVRVYAGDCLEVMRELDAESVDAVITDPPYGLGFMGHEWDQPGRSAPASRRRGHVSSARSSFSGSASGRGGGGSEAMEAGRYDLSPSVNRAFQEWCEAWATECLRVLKPGGYLAAFGGTRTSHRLTSGIEDAGFEIRDTLLWLHGQGFPKSLDVSKAIDKAAGATREVVGVDEGMAQRGAAPSSLYAKDDERGWERPNGRYNVFNQTGEITAPATPDAETWQGWGTALKPAHEPITLARKPIRGTVAANVLAHGTGALNIDACRIEGPPSAGGDSRSTALGRMNDDGWQPSEQSIDRSMSAGRWPANVILSHHPDCLATGETRSVKSDGHHPAKRGAGGLSTSGHAGQEALDERHADGETVEVWDCHPDCAVRLLDEQSGTLTTNPGTMRKRASDSTYFGGAGARPEGLQLSAGDKGGASRFYYVAKASKRERGGEHNTHPTVKPLALMCWLVRLLVPPGALILDPFAGSGTTGVAARREDVRAILVEREEKYLPIIAGRVSQQGLF